jgi:NHLM bacteriocin system ABC transporter ATP-binding protein
MKLMLTKQAGEIFEPQSNRPFSIHQPNRAWLVRSGKLDLFLVSVVDGEFSGARFPLFRVEEGSAVFGMNEMALGAVVVAVATPGTQLLVLEQAYLNVERDGSSAPWEIPALLEDWILQIGACASAAATPRRYGHLQAGKTHTTDQDANPVFPTTGVMWIQHLVGSSRLLNRQETEPIVSPGYFPVSRYGWVQPEPNSQIQSLSWSDWLTCDPQWRGLQTFHCAALQCLVLNRSRFEESNHKRRLSRVASDRRIVGVALRFLASPLQDEDADRPVDATNLDPTLNACEAIGESLGVKIVAPLELRAQESLFDPVARIAAASGLRHRRVVLKGKWWLNSPGPLLAFRESDRRPLAVLPPSRAGSAYRLHDPIEGQSVPLTAHLALTLNGFAYTFYRPLPNRKLSLWDLLVFALRGAHREIISVVGMGLCGGMLGIVVPVATGVIFNSIIPNAERDQLTQIAGILVVLAIAAAIFTLTRNVAMLRLEGKMGASLQAAIWDRLLRLPAPFFRRYTAGDLADRSLGLDSILRAITGSVVSSLLSGVFSVFSFLLLFYYNSQLALVATAIVALSCAVSAAGLYIQLRYEREVVHARGRISGMILGLIENIGKLRVSGAEPRAFAAWAQEFSKQKTLSLRARRVSSALAVFESAFPVIGLAVIFAYATQLMGQPLLHALTTGTLLAFLTSYTQFESAQLQLIWAVETALRVVPIRERATPILEAVPEVTESNRHPGELRGLIEVSHLIFRYQADGPLVLRDLSFTIRPGQFVAIVGPSGSGKSSLLRLLLGFEKPESGAIYYDGQDLSGLNVQAVRKQMGVVIQNARLASGSIFENIVGSAPLTVEDAWIAARGAGLAEDIQQMPMGLHTVVSEGGGNLSGGQRQRLLIARAIVRKPRIFLFDEATSSLDNRTQAVVSRTLESLQSTRVVIAHRLSTIVNASRIFVIEKGVLLQTGSYRELAEQPGLFRTLVKRQLA